MPGGVHFRVWAPARRQIQLVIDGGGALALEPDGGGYWAALAPGARPGTKYGFCLDGEDKIYPDPATRFQPDGPHGMSEVVDPAAFAWTDSAWPGVTLAGAVIYELHIGTFTREGTWEAARAKLPRLRDVGINVVEVMPVAEFPGGFGWGYDGVNLYAPTRLYGRPDELRRFVDEAHRLEVGVILDVVYNHLGPDGNYLSCFSPHYFSKKATEWGDAINYDGEESGPVRDYFAENAAYWIDEYHLDGLRLDATQSIFDSSPEHVLVEIGRRARAATNRPIIIVSENEPQETRLVRPIDKGGYGLDALWNDDFHHSAVVALTGRNEAYYTDHRGTAQELLSAVKHGYLFQGQRYSWQKQRRGTSARGLPPMAFIAFIENHDQVANSCSGARIWRQTTPGRYRAMSTLVALGPWTPMLFQGQEWASSAPFHYFADHNRELAPLVRKGRAEFISQFPSCATPEIQRCLPDPADPSLFERCTLDWNERDGDGHAEVVRLYADLFALRRSDAVLAAQGTGGVTIDGAVLGPECFVVRFLAPDEQDRLLIVNLGPDLNLVPSPEPLLAPPRGEQWRLTFASENPCYGGSGMPEPETANGWHIKGHAAALLALRPEASVSGSESEHGAHDDETDRLAKG